MSFFTNIQLAHFVYISGVLFALGLFGVMTQRNAVRILISVEIMLNAANLNLIAFAGYQAQQGNNVFSWDYSGWVFALMVIALAAAEAAVGLAIFISAFRSFGEIDVGYLFSLKEKSIPPEEEL